MRTLLLMAAVLSFAACEGVSGPMGEVALASLADDGGGAWTLVHAVAPQDGGPTRQYYRLIHTAGSQYGDVAGVPGLSKAPSTAPVWEVDALPPLEGPTTQSALLTGGATPTAWIAGHYPGNQVFLTRIRGDGSVKRWDLPAGWPRAYALDVTWNAERTWVRPEQWWSSRDGIRASLVELGAAAEPIAEDAFWMGCDARACAYVTYAAGVLTLRNRAGKKIAAAHATRAPRFAAACRAGGGAYVVTQAEYFPVSVTGIGAPVTHTADVRSLLSGAGELECRQSPWLWSKSDTGDLYAFDVTATAARAVTPQFTQGDWARLARGPGYWFAALAVPGDDVAMSCDPEGAWVPGCAATYKDYTLRLTRLAGD